MKKLEKCLLKETLKARAKYLTELLNLKRNKLKYLKMKKINFRLKFKIFKAKINNYFKPLTKKKLKKNFKKWTCKLKNLKLKKKN
jgi:hypothetical protein